MAFDFDGVNDKISIGDIALDGASKVTLSLWINPATTTAEFAGILVKSSASYVDRFGLMTSGTPVSGDSDELLIVCGNNSSGVFGTTQAQNILVADVWKHILIDYDGSNATPAKPWER